METLILTVNNKEEGQTLLDKAYELFGGCYQEIPAVTNCNGFETVMLREPNEKCEYPHLSITCVNYEMGEEIFKSLNSFKIHSEV